MHITITTLETSLLCFFFVDVDECAVGSDCDEHASCLNTNGSYVCTCIPPYKGDGKKCTGMRKKNIRLDFQESIWASILSSVVKKTDFNYFNN